MGLGDQSAIFVSFHSQFRQLYMKGFKQQTTGNLSDKSQ